MKKSIFNKFLFVWVLGVVFLFSSTLASVAFADSHTLVLGKVSDNPKKHYKNLKPMVDYVVPKMKDLGVTEGKVLMARDNKQAISYLRQGKLDWGKNESVDKTVKKDLEIFFRSKSFPRAVEVVRKGLDPKIKKRLKEVLLAASEKPDGKKALKAYQKTKKFDELDKKSMAGIEEAKELMKIVKAELE